MYICKLQYKEVACSVVTVLGSLVVAGTVIIWQYVAGTLTAWQQRYLTIAEIA